MKEGGGGLKFVKRKAKWPIKIEIKWEKNKIKIIHCPYN